METVIAAYRRKPLDAWAVRYDGDNADTVLAMLGRARMTSSAPIYISGPGRGMTPALKLESGSYLVTATVGDWVLVDDEGLFWSMTDEEFREEFERRPSELAPLGICWCGREVEPGENHALCSPAMD